MKDKALVIAVTRNNPVLLENFAISIGLYDAGYDYDVLIADNTSTDPKQSYVLDRFCKNFEVETFPNNRVEATFEAAANKHNDYKYFFFCHDDSLFIKNSWLKAFIDRATSGYFESDIKATHLIRCPVGRVAACHQPWRDFTSCKGYPLHSLFLKEYLDFTKQEAWIYKYADQDRTLWTNECFTKNGLWHPERFMNHPDLPQIEQLLDKHLQYADEGMYPKEKFPPGKSWNKITLLCEFLNSIHPLINGFRTVGLEGDGYLEQIDGYDKPWGNNYVAHYGSPHTKKWLGTKFNCSAEDIHKKIYSNDSTFIIRCNKLIREYFK